jgi:putative ABC transport system permease protein
VLLAATISITLTEWLLPHVNAFLDTGASFDYWRDPALLAALCGGVLVVALFAGVYPALLLASFRPVNVIKGPGAGGLGGERVRQALVTLQFSVMIGLLIAAGTTYQQLTYATHGVAAGYGSGAGRAGSLQRGVRDGGAVTSGRPRGGLR